MEVEDDLNHQTVPRWPLAQPVRLTLQCHRYVWFGFAREAMDGLQDDDVHDIFFQDGGSDDEGSSREQQG